MGGLLLFVFIALCMLGAWRVFVATTAAHGGGQITLEPDARYSVFHCRGLDFYILDVIHHRGFRLSWSGVALWRRNGTNLEARSAPDYAVHRNGEADFGASAGGKTSFASIHNDLQVVHTQVTLAYYQDPCCVTDIWAKLNDDAVDRVVKPAILEAIKAQTAQYDAEQLIAQRATVRNGIEQYVRDRLSAHHIDVDAVSITDFNFSEEYNRAIEAKVTAQQNALKAENDLTRIKIEAEQKVAQAQAEAKALEVQKQQITPELLQLRTIEMMQQHWDGHLPEVYMGSGQGGALPMIDVLKAAGRSK